MNKQSQQLKTLHATVVALWTTYNAALKADGADYSTMAKLLKTTPLSDNVIFKGVCEDVFATFGESHKDAAQIRVNIIRNARRVAYGGRKDEKDIKGKGMTHMLQIVAGVDSIRELRKALAEEVPAGLKGKSGGKTRGKAAKKTATADLSRLPKDVTSEQAMEAARKILEFIRTKFVKPSEVERTNAINACVKALTP